MDILSDKQAKSWKWLSKRRVKRETEFLLITAQNNAIRTNCFKVKIDKTLQNIRCRSCGDRDKTINHVISECSKLAQKEYKTRYDWVGKVIPWESLKKFKLDHTNKWCMHSPESVLENETHKVLWDFEIQTDHLILARRPDSDSQQKKKKKENLPNIGFCRSCWPQGKTETKRQKR